MRPACIKAGYGVNTLYIQHVIEGNANIVKWKTKNNPNMIKVNTIYFERARERHKRSFGDFVWANDFRVQFDAQVVIVRKPCSLAGHTQYILDGLKEPQHNKQVVPDSLSHLLVTWTLKMINRPAGATAACILLVEAREIKNVLRKSVNDSYLGILLKKNKACRVCCCPGIREHSHLWFYPQGNSAGSDSNTRQLTAKNTGVRLR